MLQKTFRAYVLQFFLERTNPHMLPAASSIFFTLDRCMNGEVRFKVSHHS